MTAGRVTILHAAVAALGAVELIRTLHQTWVRAMIGEQPALVAFVVALPVASALASLLAIWIGARTGERARLAAQDLLGLAAMFGSALLLSLPMGEHSRPLVGVFFVALLCIRLAPSVAQLARGVEGSPVAAFLTALIAYSALALWSGAASSAQGDQPHYLLAADELVLRHSLDVGPAYGDDTLFIDLTGGLRFGPGDLETHVARTPMGDRLVQGYGLPLLVAPGWAGLGKDGALLTLALLGALASLGTFLLVRDTIADRRAGGAAWALITFLLPLPALVGAIYPNVVGAAAIVWAYRLLLTAPRRRPLLAGILAGSTLLLTPRDGAAILLLVPFALVLPMRAQAIRFAGALIAMVIATGLFDLIAYGVPLPYAGYGFGIEMAQRLDSLPTLSFHPEIGLPGILFDRAFGLAGSAPYLFIGLAGVGAVLAGTRAPLLAALRARSLAPLAALPEHARTLGPAIATVAGSIVALSVYRLWQGGWSPPNRYLVDVLPLWAPLVALGLVALRGALSRFVSWSLVIVSALAAVLMLAIPNLGFNLSDTARLATALGDVLPVSPFAWLPSFQAPDPGALVTAWLTSLPLWLGCALLVRHGFRPFARPFLIRAALASRATQLALFVAANGAAILTLALWPFVPAEHATHDPAVAESLMTRWLPLALACATALTVALAWEAPDRVRLFTRHLALYLAVPAAGAFAAFGELVTPPLLGAPLVLLVAGIAIHGFRAVWSARHVRSDRALGLLLGATVVASAFALLPYDRTVQLTRADEPHYLLVMQSLARDHDLDLTNDYDGEYADFYPDRLPDRHIVQVGNAQRPIHDLGLPFIGALPFAIARRTGVLVLMCLIGGLLTWRGYALLRTLAFGRASALMAAGAVGLLHPALTYTTQIYPELLVALALLLALELLARPVTPTRTALVSALCGLLVWLTLRAWFITAGVGLVLLVLAIRRRDLRLVAAAIVPGALIAGAYAVLDGMIFSLWLPNAGYWAIREQQTVVAYTPWIGLTGILLDRTFGLLSHAPLYALAALGAVPLWRRARSLRSPALAALGLGALLEIAYVSNVQYWWSDGSPAPRYLVGILPLLLCALAAGIERLRGSGARLLVLVALSWTVAVTAIYALLPDLRYDLASQIAPTGGPGELWRALTFVLRADPGLLFPSLVRAAPQDAALAAAWLILITALVWAGSRRPLRA